jgi:hypothetical protein
METPIEPQDHLAKQVAVLLARYYITIEKAIRQSHNERLKLKQTAIKLLGSLPEAELLAYLASHQALVAHGFRDALTGPLREEAEAALGFTDADFEHIAKSTPGNPDIGVGGIAQPTGNGNTLVGPAVTISEGHVTMKLGAGVELAPPDHAPALSLQGLRDAAGSAVKGVGVAIGVRIDC